MKISSVMTAFEVASVAALRNITKVNNKVARTAGYTTAGDGGAGEYWLDASDTTSVDNGFTVIVADDGGRWKLISRSVSTDITVRIPTDFSTLQAAVDAIHSKVLMAQGKIIDLKFDAGHQPTAGLLVQNGDYSYFRISSVDASVTLSPSFVGVTAESTAPNSLIIGVNAQMPILNCLINANDKCNAGYFVYKNSVGTVERDCGVTYANGIGLYLARGEAFASGSNFSYANRGNRATANSNLHCEGSNFSNARGISWDPEDVFGLDVSRASTVYAMTQSSNVMDVSGSAGRGLSARRSKVAASEIVASGCALDGIRAELCSQITAGGAVVSGAGANGLAAFTGSTVEAGSVTATGCLIGVYANAKGTISATSVNASNCGTGIRAKLGSDIEASSATVNDCTGNGILIEDGSAVNANSANILRSGARGVLLNGGCTANLRAANIKNSVSEDVRIQRGSTVCLNDAKTTSSAGATPVVGDTNVPAFNAITANGIIYA